MNRLYVPSIASSYKLSHSSYNTHESYLGTRCKYVVTEFCEFMFFGNHRLAFLNLEFQMLLFESDSAINLHYHYFDPMSIESGYHWLPVIQFIDVFIQLKLFATSIFCCGFFEIFHPCHLLYRMMNYIIRVLSALLIHYYCK